MRPSSQVCCLGTSLTVLTREGNCSDAAIASILKDPDDNEYDCTSISPSPGQSVQISEWCAETTPWESRS